jgi:hypothetical protein
MTSQRKVQLVAFISYSIIDYKSLRKEANKIHYLNSNIHESITISIPAKTRSVTIDGREITNQDIGFYNYRKTQKQGVHDLSLREAC